MILLALLEFDSFFISYPYFFLSFNSFFLKISEGLGSIVLNTPFLEEKKKNLQNQEQTHVFLEKGCKPKKMDWDVTKTAKKHNNYHA